jgi:ATP-dependent Lhr-like helicase
LRRSLPLDVSAGAGALDAAAIEQVSADAWPSVRNADELHDALLTLVRLPPVAQWQGFYEELIAARRARTLNAGDAAFWVAAERAAQACDAVVILRGWLESAGPMTAAALSERLALPRDQVDIALAQLEAEGQVMRGQFSPALAGGEVEWCNRRLLARIHRLTLGRLRSEIEPVTSADFVRFLARWQHAVPGAQLHGPDGALQVIRQLQGYEISGAAWESHILPRRVAGYQPDLLDRLCLAGEVMWGRLSPHPAFEREEPGRVRPTRVAPVTLFLREDAEWLLARAAGETPGPGEDSLSHPARETMQALTARGASFFPELVRATGRLPSEVEDALWELVAAGIVTADGFENLRSLMDPKRRRGEGNGRLNRPRHAAGRWALMRLPEQATMDTAEPFARQLLSRWGVVFRDMIARESLAPAWRDMLQVLRRMEARGEIRGGRFVTGFTGEQFATPEALETLRSLRRSRESGIGDSPDHLLISTADPLNLAGIILPGPRISGMTGGVIRLVEPAEITAAAS